MGNYEILVVISEYFLQGPPGGGGPRDPYNRGNHRNHPKPMMGGTMGMRGQHMQDGYHPQGWMSPRLTIPPPPPRPPKVMELHREKVELHKAENAWKPSVKQSGSAVANDESLSEEDKVIEVSLGLSIGLGWCRKLHI